MLDSDHFFYRYSAPPAPPNNLGITREMAYDGHVFYIGESSDKGTSSVEKLLGDNPRDGAAAARTIDVPYLRAAGFGLPPTVSKWRTPPLDSLVIQYATTGKLTSASADKNKVALRFEIPDPVVAFAKGLDLDLAAKQMGGANLPGVQRMIDKLKKTRSLDPMRRVEMTLVSDKGYCIEHSEDRTSDGGLIQTVDCDDFEYFPQAQLWLPRRCTQRDYARAAQLSNGSSKEPTMTTVIHLVKLSLGRPEGVSFQLAYGPGSVVVERSTASAQNSPDGKIVYRKPADEKELTRAAEEVKGGSPRRILVIVNLIVLLLLGVFYAGRRWLLRSRGK
ncbi:MAG TPA: hypothetical protein VG055_32560 [Planctomycetaceae bacterium]|nr:hypothetical protein [Planctomycetaceae bacterium]